MKKLFFLIAAAVCTLPLLVNAAEPGKDWELYGSARMSGWYWDRAMFYGDTVAFNPSTYNEDPVRQKRMIWDLEYMSRFGAHVKKDKYAFRFELGWNPTIRQYNVAIVGFEANTAAKYRDGLVLRRLYGEWFINQYLTLLIGQEWCIANFFPSAQAFDMESGLCYSGALYTGRKPQVRLSGEVKNIASMLNARAEFSVVKPDTSIIGTWDEARYVDAEEIIPKLEGGATIEFQQGLVGIKTQLVAGINRYNLVTHRNQPNLTTRNLVNTNCLAADIDLTVWKCRLSFAYAQGTNLASYGVLMGNPWGDRTDEEIMLFYPRWGLSASDSINLHLCDVFTKQGCAVFNFKPFNFLAFEIGAGKILNFPEAFDYLRQAEGYGKNVNRRWAWYTNLQFSLLDGHMLIIPEYSFSDLGGGTSNPPSQPPNAGKWKAYGVLLQFDM